MIPNSLDVTNDGKIYWTDSSTTHKLYDGVLIFMGPATGRLLVTDPVTKSSKVLMNGIHFANGVHLSTDESYVLVAETQRARVLRYWLKGKKAGKSEVFVDKLPGLPDNINHNGKDKFIVSLVNPGSHFTNALPQLPLLRKFLARLMTLAQLTVQEINSLFPSFWLARAHHMIGHFEMISPLKVFDEPRATVVLINHEGQITNCLHATDGNVTDVSSMVAHNGFYYLGSPFNDYLARVRI
uniref:Adipocyte plasma membrane-associated protein n=3 Tax=Lygus hesperus TaxID=30085 RepID=A0A0A9Y2G8_LYGHE